MLDANGQSIQNKSIHFNNLQYTSDHYWTSLDMAEVDALSASRSSKKAPFGRFFVGDALIKREKDRNTRM